MRRCWCNISQWLVVALVTLSAVLLALACASFPLLSLYVKSQVTKNIVLKPGNAFYKAWEGGKNSPPVLHEIYLFNLTNEMEVVDFGSKPNVIQQGPYVYKLYREKQNVTWHSNRTLSYRERHRFVFDPRRSAGAESDLVTTINMPLITLLTYLPEKIPFLSEILRYVVKEDIFITKSVHELVWGYNDTLLQMAHNLDPSLVPDTVVGVMYGQNNSDQGELTVHTGQRNPRHIGTISSWKGMSSLAIWSDKYANMINGTDGSVAPPLHTVDKHFKLQMFSPDICRSVYGVYTDSVRHHGIDVLRFMPPAREFLNATLDPDNAGFCLPGHPCFGTGVVDTSKCTPGKLEAPSVMSWPHFLFGDQRYVDAVIGINPNQQDLNTEFDIEPLTGLILKASKRLQINFNINNTLIVKDVLKNTPSMLYPILWINETMSANEQQSEDLRAQLDQLWYSQLAQILAFSLAGLLLLVAVTLCAIYPQTRAIKRPGDALLLNDTEEELLDTRD